MRMIMDAWGDPTEEGRPRSQAEAHFTITERADNRVGEGEACFILRDRNGKITGCLTVSAIWLADMERQIIERHHGAVRAAMMTALRTGEPAQPPAGVMASFEALKAEHTRLRAMHADLTSRHEALQRDFQAEYSVSRVPRSSDMADVVRAQTTG